MSVAHISIVRDREIGRIEQTIYGHFLESHFYGNIEGGVFDEGSPLAEPGPGARAGLRTDVIEACRRLGLPVVRWPGGNFTSSYHWRDGVGHRQQRPRRLDLNWFGEESNRFGTDEFLAWCAATGAEPYLVHSCRDVEEAAAWLEYTNYPGDTAMTRLRAVNGHPEPYGVRYWGVGNEVYGRWQMGHRHAAAYAADAAEHARFLRRVDPGIELIGVGMPDDHRDWNREVLSAAGQQLDYLSVHAYGASTHLYTTDRRGEYRHVVDQADFFAEQLTAACDGAALLADELALDRPVSICMDEWNMRHVEPERWDEPEPGDDGACRPRADIGPAACRPDRTRVNRWSPRTLADALFHAGVFHAMHRLSGHPAAPRMANTVNLVNANALLAVRPDGLTTSTTYQVWDLYQNHMGPIAVPVRVAGPERQASVR